MTSITDIIFLNTAQFYIMHGEITSCGHTRPLTRWDFLRAMLNNESDYPEPRQFRPERFLTSNGMLRKDDGVRDPIDIVFGFGRRFVKANYAQLILPLTSQFLFRICPGAHIGYSILWLTAASLLTVFDIDKTLDADGHPIEPSCEYNSGAVS